MVDKEDVKSDAVLEEGVPAESNQLLNDERTREELQGVAEKSNTPLTLSHDADHGVANEITPFTTTSKVTGSIEENGKNGLVIVDSKYDLQRNRILKTLALYISFFALGLSASLVGLTIVHMEIIMGTSTKNMAFTFTGHSLGYTVGAVVCGVAYDRTNKELAFFVSVLLESFATISAAFVGDLLSFIIAMMFQGLAMGFIDAGSQSYCVGLWHNHRLKEPILQGAHAIWSLGAAIGPQVINPFLVELSSNHDTTTSANSTDSNSTTELSFTGNASVTSSVSYDITTRSPEEMRDIARAQYAYLAIGLCMLLSSVLFGVLFFYRRGPLIVRPVPPVKTAPTAETKRYKKKTRSCGPLCIKFGLLILLFLFYYFYLYIENIPSAFFPTFAIKWLGWSVKDSTFLMSIFFGFHFAGRILGVPISACLRPRTMLMINLAVTAAAYVLLLFVNLSDALLWVSAAAAGIAMASTFASMVLWMSETMTISGKVSALLLVGSSIGGMTAPLLVGQLMDNVSAMCMVYVLVVAGLIHIVLFAVIWVCVAKRRRLLTEIDVKK